MASMFGPIRDEHHGTVHTGALKLLGSAILHFKRYFYFAGSLQLRDTSLHDLWIGFPTDEEPGVNRAFVSWHSHSQLPLHLENSYPWGYLRHRVCDHNKQCVFLTWAVWSHGLIFPGTPVAERWGGRAWPCCLNDTQRGSVEGEGIWNFIKSQYYYSAFVETKRFVRWLQGAYVNIWTISWYVTWWHLYITVLPERKSVVWHTLKITK